MSVGCGPVDAVLAWCRLRSAADRFGARWCWWDRRRGSMSRNWAGLLLGRRAKPFFGGFRNKREKMKRRCGARFILRRFVAVFPEKIPREETGCRTGAKLKIVLPGSMRKSG